MDELDFEYLNTFPEGDPARKALVFLKAGISTFAKKNYRDEPTLKLIVAALTQAPLLIPVEVDFDELLGELNPEDLSPDQELHPKSGSKPTWVTARLSDGTEVIPMFTSRKEAAKGEKVPLMWQRTSSQPVLPMRVQSASPMPLDKPNRLPSKSTRRRADTMTTHF